MSTLEERYHKLAKLHGSTKGRQECKVSVPVHDFDKIASTRSNPQSIIRRGQLDVTGEGYFETVPGSPGQFYNPDVVTFVREEI